MAYDDEPACAVVDIAYPFISSISSGQLSTKVHVGYSTAAIPLSPKQNTSFAGKETQFSLNMPDLLTPQALATGKYEVHHTSMKTYCAIQQLTSHLQRDHLFWKLSSSTF